MLHLGSQHMSYSSSNVRKNPRIVRKIIALPPQVNPQESNDIIVSVPKSPKFVIVSFKFVIVSFTFLVTVMFVLAEFGSLKAYH